MKEADLPQYAVIHQAGPTTPDGVSCVHCGSDLSGDWSRRYWPQEGEFVAVWIGITGTVVDDAMIATCCDGKQTK